MSWDGKTMGGILGPGVDAQPDDALVFSDDEVGRHIKLTLCADCADQQVALIRFLCPRTHQFVCGEAPYCDEHGNALFTAAIVKNVCRVFIPFGILAKSDGHDLSLVFARPGDANPALRPQEIRCFSLPGFRTRDYSKVEHLEPLIQLGMLAARIDRSLASEEGQRLRDFFTGQFHLTALEIEELKAVMRREPRRELARLVEATLFRFPEMLPEGLVELLLLLTQASGAVDSVGVGLIRQVGEILGLDPSRVSLAEQMHLREQERSYSTLGARQGAGAEEVRAAYLRMAALYHPDKYANAPIEFQDLATLKMREINAAYEILGELHQAQPGQAAVNFPDTRVDPQDPSTRESDSARSDRFLRAMSSWTRLLSGSPELCFGDFTLSISEAQGKVLLYHANLKRHGVQVGSYQGHFFELVSDRCTLCFEIVSRTAVLRYYRPDTIEIGLCEAGDRVDASITCQWMSHQRVDRFERTQCRFDPRPGPRPFERCHPPATPGPRARGRTLGLGNTVIVDNSMTGQITSESPTQFQVRFFGEKAEWEWVNKGRCM